MIRIRAMHYDMHCVCELELETLTSRFSWLVQTIVHKIANNCSRMFAARSSLLITAMRHQLLSITDQYCWRSATSEHLLAADAGCFRMTSYRKWDETVPGCSFTIQEGNMGFSCLFCCWMAFWLHSYSSAEFFNEHSLPATRLASLSNVDALKYRIDRWIRWKWPSGFGRSIAEVLVCCYYYWIMSEFYMNDWRPNIIQRITKDR